MNLHALKYINCIIVCNKVLYSFFPHVLSLHILCIQLQTVKYINCIINCNIVKYSLLTIFFYFISCIQSYRSCKLLIVILTVILTNIHISSVFYHSIPSIKPHKQKYFNSIFTCNIVPYSYFPHVISLHILYI